jgi:hypothetical protein
MAGPLKILLIGFCVTHQFLIIKAIRKTSRPFLAGFIQIPFQRSLHKSEIAKDFLRHSF